jgi:hypothetical protein
MYGSRPAGSNADSSHVSSFSYHQRKYTEIFYIKYRLSPPQLECTVTLEIPLLAVTAVSSVEYGWASEAEHLAS